MNAIASIQPPVKPAEAVGDSDDLCDDSYAKTWAEDSPFRYGSRTRRLRKVILESRLRDFLQVHSFEHVNDSKRLSRGGSKVYPIHIAAEMADAGLVRLLLQAGAHADPIFRGRTACQIAEEVNHKGSHDGVIALLQGGGLKLLSA